LSSLNEKFSTMDVPGLRQSSFTINEQEIGGMWHDVLKKETMQAVSEERRLSIE